VHGATVVIGAAIVHGAPMVHGTAMVDGAAMVHGAGHADGHLFTVAVFSFAWSLVMTIKCSLQR
jgi:hypothetical protein